MVRYIPRSCQCWHAALVTYKSPCLAWYIPPEWLPTSARLPRNIVEAAELAAELASAAPNRNISYSDIPLIIHQTWKNTQIDTWSKITCESIERWLSFAVGVPMAYFLWDDDGVNQMLEAFNPEWTVQFKSLPANVERSDVFRIMVSNNFGGIVCYYSPLSV